MKNPTKHPDKVFEEVDDAVQRLYSLVHCRWHPKQGGRHDAAPKDVRDALEDLREITLELKGLWDYLGGALGRAA